VHYQFHSHRFRNNKNIAKDLQTESAKQLAKKIKERNPLQWLYNFAKIPPEDEKQ